MTETNVLERKHKNETVGPSAWAVNHQDRNHFHCQSQATRGEQSAAKQRQTDRQTHGRQLLSLTPSLSLSLFSPFQPWTHLLPLSPTNHPCPNKWNKPAQVQTAGVQNVKNFLTDILGSRWKQTFPSHCIYVLPLEFELFRRSFIENLCRYKIISYG